MALENYTPTHWEDADSTETPINAANLNNIENGIEAVTEAVQKLEQDVPQKATTKQTEDEADSGYVTPAIVGQIVDRIFSSGALKYVNGTLTYTDKNSVNHRII